MTTFDVFLWSFVKDQIYIPLMTITLNNLKDHILTAVTEIDQLYCKTFGTKSSTILMCAGQQMEHILNFHGV
jgi:hypothetical protein